MKAYSLLHLALVEEINDIIEAETAEDVKSVNQFGDDDGNIYFPISGGYEINSILKEGLEENRQDWTFHSVEEMRDLRDSEAPFSGKYYSYNSFISNFIDTDLKIIRFNEDSNFNLLKFLADFYKLNTGYGILITNDKRRNYMINPLHPMVAFAIMLGQIELPKAGKIVIYQFKEDLPVECSSSRRELFNQMEDVKKLLPEINFDKFEEEEAIQVNDEDDNELIFLKRKINRYIKRYTKVWTNYIQLSPKFITDTTVKKILNIDKDKYLMDLAKFKKIKYLKQFGDIDYSNITHGSTPNALLVPLQMLANSVTYPYYGLSFIWDPTNPDRQGYNLGLMLTGNIKYNPSTGVCASGGEAYTDNVCTGSLPKDRKNGWITLSRINVDSMWFSDLIIPDMERLYTYIKTSQFIAGKFYSLMNKKREESNEAANENGSN